MDLASIIKELSIDYGYLAGSIIAANSMIYHIYKKEPFYLQHKPKSKALIDGLNARGSRFMIESTLRLLGAAGAMTLVSYGLDELLDINKYWINGHNAFCYGAGSFLYLSAISNYIDFKIRRRSIRK